MHENETEPYAPSQDAPMPDKFYLPAVALRPKFGRIEDVVTDLFDFHDVVLIPDSYNE